MSDSKKFRDWDDRYAASDYLFGTAPNDFLKTVAHQLAPNSQILCLADGEGRNGVYLAAQGHTVTAVDQSRVGLEKAKKLAQQKQVSVETIKADLAEYDLGVESWDCIVSIFFHIPSEVRANIYPRIIAALKPGGSLILESYTPNQLNHKTGGPPTSDLMLTKDQLTQYFSEMNLEHLQELEREVIEGTGHTGLASVVQLLALR
ncbi:MAG: class I SAM-dependent methyltransferase [Gammaproteobacteria bacterium]|jgi:2-polyprenyl-3-methyl-5-hydroxy-6-metoxy-1,4-benzoquinol methylase|nr:class I SAM-dependent methyltransferase [Gammaproteobacteria bacterium]MBT5684991.1 class I SAM-dependent methyltransferase [Gammaproteobacteria bacterium]MBT6582864.1 class I SAM-dependent methyltransferase [Gammaproteobacteria bacterium]MDG1232660.1 class I SAM-dependent methyltransferase [Pseudomonadales bacterium]